MSKRDDETKAKRNVEVVADAHKKWKLCYDWFNPSLKKALEDFKFAHGDSDNNFQWPGDVLDARGGPESDKPILTINKVRQNNLLIINDAKKNKPAIKFRPVGNGATAESAQIWNGLARHIESQSQAQNVYDKAVSFMVKMGFGYWRITTDYVSDKSFDQEIYIKNVLDPWSVLLDKDAKEPDKSDANYGFISEDVTREIFDIKYPKYKHLPSALTLTNDGINWVTRDAVRVAEFYRRELTKDVLYAYVGQRMSEPVMLYRSELKDPEMLAKVERDAKAQRDVERAAVKWFFIVGDQVVEEKDWASKYIPIVKIVAEETIIENKYDCKGHTRYLKDPQRMYNYFSKLCCGVWCVADKNPVDGFCRGDRRARGGLE